MLDHKLSNHLISDNKIQENEQESIRLLKLSAGYNPEETRIDSRKKMLKNGYAPAQCDLGKYYVTGNHIEKDHYAALTLLISAARKEEKEAVEALSKPHIVTSYLGVTPFFSIDDNHLKDKFTRNDIVEIIDVMGSHTGTRKRLQHTKSNFIGKIVTANRDKLTLPDLLDINNSLTSVIGVEQSACLPIKKQDTESLKTIQNHLRKGIKSLLETNEIKEDNLTNKNFRITFDGENICCELANNSYGFTQVVPLEHSSEHIIENKIKPFASNSNSCRTENGFSLIFNKENLQQITEYYKNSQPVTTISSAQTIKYTSDQGQATALV